MKSYDKPHKYLMISLDGMDQKKTELPHYKRLPKSLDAASLIGVHVVGVLVMNGGLRTRAYMTYGNFRNDPNLTVAVIQDVINNWEGELPEVLYLQMDNTAAQNKNNTVLAYLNMLVEHGIFKKVKVGFLLVGHTYDQIDQIFSRFSVMLGIKDVMTMDELIAILEKAYTPVPQMKVLTQVPDFRSFLWPPGEPPAADLELHDHSYQHQFKIEKDEVAMPADGDAQAHMKLMTIMRGKELSTHEYWEPEEGVQLLWQIPTRQISAAPQVALALRTKLRQPASAALAVPLRPIQALEAYKTALHESRQHLSDDQRMWWDGFWISQAKICEEVESGQTLPLEPPWSWYERTPRAAPAEPVEPTAVVVENPPARRLRQPQGRMMYAGPRRSNYGQACKGG